MVAVLLWAKSASAAGPAGKDFGKWWGTQDAKARFEQKAIRDGDHWVWYKNTQLTPRYQDVRSLWGYHQNNQSLSGEQQHFFVEWLDKVLGEETLKRYNDLFHRGFAKLKGGWMRDGFREGDYDLMLEFLRDPSNFDRARVYGTPSTSLDQSTKPASQNLLRNIFRLSDTATPEKLRLLPPADSTPAQLPPANKGFAYLHSMPEAAPLIKLDDMSVPPEQGKLAIIITIGGIIVRAAAQAMGVPVP